MTAQGSGAVGMQPRVDRLAPPGGICSGMHSRTRLEAKEGPHEPSPWLRTVPCNHRGWKTPLRPSKSINQRCQGRH